ncbi:MAG: NADH dehydrogenase FAD-containing subunit, partial [Verrucomicrobiaceae bacterium]
MMNPPPIPLPDALIQLAPVVAGPLWLIAFLLIPDQLANRDGRRFADLAASSAIGVLLLAMLAMAGRLNGGPLAVEVTGAGPVGIDVYFDTLSAIMMLLVSFLGAVVLRYSVNYLAGDPRQGRFIKWLCVTTGSVLTLIISGNLLMFTLAWVATSMSLHQLLMFYPDRPGALLAARKKFLISRLGDACLAAALIVTWQCFGTWKFTGMFAAARQA